MKGYVQVYRNLNKKLHDGDHGPVYSVRGDDGLVKKHTCHITLWDCTLRVREKGNQRVRDEKRKNVHAYVLQGKECWSEGEKRWVYIQNMVNFYDDSVAITYNPYKNGSFVRVDNGEPVYEAEVVVFGCGEKGREVRAILR